MLEINELSEEEYTIEQLKEKVESLLNIKKEFINFYDKKTSILLDDKYVLKLDTNKSINEKNFDAKDCLSNFENLKLITKNDANLWLLKTNSSLKEEIELYISYKF